MRWIFDARRTALRLGTHSLGAGKAVLIHRPRRASYDWARLIEDGSWFYLPGTRQDAVWRMSGRDDIISKDSRNAKKKKRVGGTIKHSQGKNSDQPGQRMSPLQAGN